MKLPCVVVTWVRPLWRNSITYAQCCEYWACRLLSSAGSLVSSMKSIPCWKAYSRTADQEIPRILWTPRVRCSVYNNPPFLLIPSQMIPLHTLPAYFFKNSFVITRYFQPFLTRGLLVRLGSHTRIVHKLLSCTIRTCPTLSCIIGFHVIAEILYVKEQNR